MNENNKGCCCLCPAYVGVTIMFLIQAAVLACFITICLSEGVQEWPDNYVKKVFIMEATIQALLLTPYVWVLFDRNNSCARLVLFIANILNWIAWGLTYRTLNFLAIIQLQNLIKDAKGHGTIHDTMDPDFSLVIDLTGFAILIIGMAFSANCFYNFWYKNQYKEEM